MTEGDYTLATAKQHLDDYKAKLCQVDLDMAQALALVAIGELLADVRELLIELADRGQ